MRQARHICIFVVVQWTFNYASCTNSEHAHASTNFLMICNTLLPHVMHLRVGGPDTPAGSCILPTPVLVKLDLSRWFRKLCGYWVQQLVRSMSKQFKVTLMEPVMSNDNDMASLFDEDTTLMDLRSQLTAKAARLLSAQSALLSLPAIRAYPPSPLTPRL